MPIWLRSALFTVFVPGSVAGFIPYLLVTGSTRPPLDLGRFRWLGIIPLGLGVATYLATAWEFGAVGRGTPGPWDPPRALVRTGMHRWVRNPMYLGVLSCLLGEALLFQASVLFIYLPLVWLAFHCFVFVYEEPTLRRMFTSGFDTYVKQVPRWVPRRPRREGTRQHRRIPGNHTA